MKWSNDRERWLCELDLCSNDYNVRLDYWFDDWVLGLWKRVWKSGKRVGICWGQRAVEK